jgi:hypothetical protein
MTAGKTVPELTPATPPVVGTDEMLVYRSPGPLKRTPASVLGSYVNTVIGTAFTRTLLDDADAATARTTLGATGTAALAASTGAALVGATGGGTAQDALDNRVALIDLPSTAAATAITPDIVATTGLYTTGDDGAGALYAPFTPTTAVTAARFPDNIFTSLNARTFKGLPGQVIYDDFGTKPNGTALGATVTGQSWMNSTALGYTPPPTALGEINSGRFRMPRTAPAGAGSYLFQELKAPLVMMETQFRFVAGTGTRTWTGAMALIGWATTPAVISYSGEFIPYTNTHLVVTRYGWDLGAFSGSSNTIIPITSGSFGINTILSTGTTTSGSNSVTAVTPTTNVAIGMTIEGPNLPTGVTITNIVGTTITMSANATASGAGAVLYINASPLAFDVPLRLWWVQDPSRNRLTIGLPDGSVFQLTDAKFATPTFFPCWEPYRFNGITDDHAEVSTTMADSRDLGYIDMADRAYAASITQPRRVENASASDVSYALPGSTAVIPGLAGTFYYPASGKLNVTIEAFIEQTGAGLVLFELKNGASALGGGARTASSSIVNGNCSVSFTVTGTPGTASNITAYAFQTGTANLKIYQPGGYVPSLTVEPLFS